MDAQFWLGIVLGALLPALFWFFKPDGLRRKVGIDSMPDYQVPGITEGALQADPVIGRTLPAASALSWQFENAVSRYLAQGYSLFLTSDGRRCTFPSSEGKGPFVLLIKPASKSAV